MRFKHIIPVAAFVLSVGLTSCVQDLNVTPIDPSTIMVPNEIALYTKCYANMALAGQGGANGDCDIDRLDGGTTGFLRQLFNANELTTDEAVCAWGDTGIPAFNFNSWDASHPMLEGFYNRLYAGIAYCNHYLNVCGEAKDGAHAQRIAEVRFLRCLYYYHLMDCFGNVSFVTALSAEAPHQIKRADLFAWIESELIGAGEAKEIASYDHEGQFVIGHLTTTDNAIREKLATPVARTSANVGYGTADQDAANLLLARMYLNAEVYTGKARWEDALKYAKLVIEGPHKLWTGTITDISGREWSSYQMLFMGNNGESGASQEAILPLLQDGLTTTSWGTTLFLMASCWKADMQVIEDLGEGKTYNNYGSSEFWAGNRARKPLLDKFFPGGDAPQNTIEAMVADAGDDRALFYGVERELEATRPGEFTDGYSVGKFTNAYPTGMSAHNNQFPDADYFLMRSAEAYLIAAEADARLHGDQATEEGVGYINALRSRANAAIQTTYSTRQILDERSRELYYEGFRRTDLIRYGLFGGPKSSEYVWEWKNGTLAGRGFDEHLNVFALPAEDVNANPNLIQNKDY